MSAKQQYAIPLEFQHWARGIPPEYLARYLRCTPATARAWQSGKRPAPWWAVHVLRLDKLERDEMARQMGYAHLLPRLGIVSGEVIEFRARRRSPPAPKPASTPSITPMPEPGQRQA